MDVRNCRDCRKIFNYVAGPPICPACREKREAKFKEVKEYIYQNPGAGIGEIVQDCEVSINQLHAWIRESRLQFSDKSPITIPCEKCGNEIKSGRYCDKCRAELSNNLKSAYVKKPSEDPKKTSQGSDRMRFLDRDLK